VSVLYKQKGSPAPQLSPSRSSPPTSPTILASNRKRKHQSRIDELFLPGTSTNPKKSRRLVVESESGSEDLDNIRFQPEQAPDPSDVEELSDVNFRSNKSRRLVVDSESDSDVGEAIRTQNGMALSPKKAKRYLNADVLNYAVEFEEIESVSDSNDDLSDDMDKIHFQTEIQSDPPEVDEVSDADTDDVVSPRVRRQRHLPPSSPPIETPQTPQDLDSDDELREEVRDITSSAKKTYASQRIRDAKSRNKKKSEFQRHLESLRKKKSGVETDSADESVQERRPIYESSDADSVGSNDFVVDDEDGLTQEQMMEIPPEFTSLSYQGPQANFKVVIQAEVYALLHPQYQGMDYTGIIE
jgi:hypothetical protein